MSEAERGHVADTDLDDGARSPASSSPGPERSRTKVSPPEPDEDRDPPPEEILLGILGQETAHRVQVYRFNRIGKPVYLTTYPVDTFSLEELQKDQGGGKFQCRVMDTSSKHIGTRTVEIFGRPKEPREDPDEEELSTVLRKSLEEMQETIRELQNPPARAEQSNPFELAISLMGAMQNMQSPYIEALLERTREERPGVQEMLELFREGMDFARSQDPGSDPMARVLTSLSPALAGALTNQTPALPAGNPGAGPNQEAEGMAKPRDLGTPPEWHTILARAIPQLQAWASRGKDPDLRAELVVDDLSDSYVELIRGATQNLERFTAEFHARFPETRPFEAWYRRFFEGIAYLLQEDDSTETGEGELQEEEPGEDRHDFGPGELSLQEEA